MTVAAHPQSGGLAGEDVVQSLSFSDVDFTDSIFDSVRQDYPDFSEWIQRCLAGRERRLAFAIQEASGSYRAVAIVKIGEGPAGVNPQGMKISTFRVAPSEVGGGCADRLLEAILQLAFQEEVLDLFVTVPPGHDDLIRYLERSGFRRAPTATSKGEHVYTANLANYEQIYPYVNRLAFDALAAEYELRAENPGPSQEKPSSLAELLTENIQGPCRRLLELGPGSGTVLAELHKRAQCTIAVELSPAMARLSAARSPDSTIVIGNARDIEFPDAHFDGIFAGAFLHLFPKAEAEKLIAQMARWTRTGGAILVNTSITGQSSEGHEEKLDYVRRVARFRSRWSESEFKEMLTSNGFQILRRATTNERERKKYWVAFVCEPVNAGG